MTRSLTEAAPDDGPTRLAAGSLDFGGLTIGYDDRVLTPRPWTRLQSEWAAELAVDAAPGPILELCCGAGHIGLLAAHLSGRSLVAVDLNPVACSWTRDNAAAAGLRDRVDVRHADLCAALDAHELFPLVLADPPWVPSAGTGRFPEDPLEAIDGGDDGLDVARSCLLVAGDQLAHGGDLLLQLGTSAQADALVADGGWLDAGRRPGARGLVVRLRSAAADEAGR